MKDSGQKTGPQLDLTLCSSEPEIWPGGPAGARLACLKYPPPQLNEIGPRVREQNGLEGGGLFPTREIYYIVYIIYNIIYRVYHQYSVYIAFIIIYFISIMQTVHRILYIV